MKIKLLLFLFLFLAFSGFSQSYDKDLLTKEFHKGRREAVRNLMPDSSCAVFFSAPQQKRANDTYFIYHQDPDFYYLTGLTEPNSLLILFKEVRTFYDTITTNELIFVQDRNPSQEAWTGKLLGKDGVRKQLGFRYVLLNDQFADFKVDFEKFYKVYHLELPPPPEDDKN